MRILFAIFLLTIASFHTNAEGFLSGFEDIPLIDGATQLEKETFSFGNEEARYIEAHIRCVRGTTFGDVKIFYKDSLTQLGWIEQKNLPNIISFARENDVLEISKTANSPLKISIILKSKN